MTARKLFISVSLAALVIAAALLLRVVGNAGRQTVPYHRIGVGDYQNRAAYNDAYALIKTPAQYETLFSPTALMRSKRPLTPPPELYNKEQILVVTRTMAAPKDHQLDKVFEVERILARGGELMFYYRFNEPTEIATFSVLNYLAVRIPKHDYKKVIFFENGKQVEELKLYEGQWLVSAMTPKPGKPVAGAEK
jgi:hypothetical protein